MIATLAAPALARAQSDVGDESAAHLGLVREKSAALLRAAIDLQEQGKHDAALETIEQALAALWHAKILYYKVLSLRALGRPQEALEILEVIDGHPDLGKYQDEIARGISEVRVLLGPRRVTLSADGVVGAAVEIDDAPACQTPCEVTLAQGRHRIVMLKDGYEAAQLEIEVGTDEHQQWSQALQPSWTAPPPEPPPVTAVGEEQALDWPWQEPWVAWGSIAAGAAGFLGGIGFVGKHYADRAELDERLNSCPDGARCIKQKPINLQIGIPLGAVGAALSTFGAWLLATQQPEPARPDS